MPKMTAKYAGASRMLGRLGLSTGGDQEAAYGALRDAGYLWDSTEKTWIKLADEPADPATPFVMVRVWADSEVVAEAADVVSEALTQKGFLLVEASPAYPCRPPKQLESRIYLKMMPPRKRAK